VRDRLNEFGDVSVAIATFAPKSDLGAYRTHLEMPFPLLADPDRKVYQQFGLQRGSLRQIWGLGTIKLYAQLLRKGHRLRAPTQDTRQLGGDFVIGPDGRLAQGFWPSSPDGRPPIDALIDAVNAAR